MNTQISEKNGHEYYERICQYAQQVVCTKLNIDPSVFMYEAISGRGKQKVNARFMLWYILNKKFGLSTVYIGKLYSRDHTTVGYGINRVTRIFPQSKIDEVMKVSYPPYPHP